MLEDFFVFNFYIKKFLNYCVWFLIILYWKEKRGCLGDNVLIYGLIYLFGKDIIVIGK